ncbi:hypothetical protein [Halosimplex marinum]|uniref:hypothetical protein n=1 Tax=Halosimplex marinum TaxID=3396620 RepID=UPI003F55DC9B
MRFLLTAEPFGFGPASKAKTVARYIEDAVDEADILVATEKSALEFSRNNVSVFDEIYDTERVSVDSILADERIDGLVSVMEADAVVAAANRRVPAYFVDSLYWFWEWESPESVIDSFESGAPPETTDAEYAALTRHETKIVAHLLSDHSFVQTFPGWRRDDVAVDRFAPISRVNPIVDTTYDFDERTGDRILLNFCGQLSPAASLDDAVTYVETVLEAMSPTLSELQGRGYQPLIAGNSTVLEGVDTSYPARSLSHETMLSEIDAADLLFSPPSITTLYEASLYETPVCLLPEQHPGHWRNYRRMKENGKTAAYPGFVMGDRYARLRSTSSDVDYGTDEGGPGAVYELLERPEIKQRLRSTYETAPAILDRSESVLASQRDVLLGARSGSGGRTVATHVKQALA